MMTKEEGGQVKKSKQGKKGMDRKHMFWMQQKMPLQE